MHKASRAKMYGDTKSLCKNWIITLIFKKNANFLAENHKIAENSDHNIDPRYVSM
jgi:hypothetical protein